MRPAAILDLVRHVARATRATATVAVLAMSSSPGRAPPATMTRAMIDPDVHNVAYNGQFTFARIRYLSAPGGYYYRGLPAWAHGFDQAETNLMKIMREVTALRPRLAESNVFALDDPQLMK